MKGRNPHNTGGDRQDYSARVLTKRLKREPIKNIPLKELVKPDKYAHSIAKSMKITRTQLRKIYSEFKEIFDSFKKNKKFDDEALTRLYMLYPIIEYQKNRGVISEDFAKLITALLENIEKYHSEEDMDRAYKFLTALIAYTPKES